MRKSIAVIVVLLLILLGIAPYLSGYYFKKEYLAVLANLNKEQDYKVEVLHYESGWLGAEAELRVTFPQATEKLKNVVPGALAFTIYQTITHGPLVHNPITNGYTIAMVSVHSKVHLPEQVESLLLNATHAQQGAIQIYSVASFGDEYFNHIQTLPLTLPVGTPASASWQGINGDVDLTVKNNIITRIRNNLAIGALIIRIDDAQHVIFPSLEFVTQPITVIGDSTRLASGLWEGNSTIVVPSIFLKDATGLKFSVENFKLMNLSKSEANNFYNLSNSLTVQKIDLTSLGAPNIAPASMITTFNHINAKELANVMHMEKTMPTSSEETQKKYLSLLPRLITPSSTINQDLSINTSYGAFTLKGLASWPNNATLPVTVDDIIDKANANITMRMAIPLANQLIEQSAKSMAQDAAKEAAYQAAQAAPPAPTPAPAVAPTPGTPSPEFKLANKQFFDQRIAELVRLGKLPLAQAIQVMDAASQYPTVDGFTTNIKSFNLAPDVEPQVIQFYSQLIEKINSPQPNMPAPVAAMPPAPTPPQQPPQTPPMDAAQMQQMISNSGKKQLDQWVKDGYITQEQNDYVVIITRENGVFKINGKDLPPELALPNGSSTPSTPPTPTMPATPTTPATPIAQ